MLYIDPDECIDCGACEPACPVNAIFAEDDVPDNFKAYTEINALWFKDKPAARAKVGQTPIFTLKQSTRGLPLSVSRASRSSGRFRFLS